MFLKISQNSQENSFFCEFCETFESIFFIEHVWWLLLLETIQTSYLNVPILDV